MDYQSIRPKNAPVDKNDCTVITTAVVTGIEYTEAQAILAANGRKPNKGCSQIIYHEVIRKLGFIIKQINLESKTVRTAERELAQKWGGCKVMVNIRRHVLAWNGTECVDWSVGRQMRVTSAFLVYPATEYEPIGRSVPVPIRRKLNKPKWTVSAVTMTIDGNTTQHRSVKAAYEAAGLQLSGHQQIRKLVKYYGGYTFSAYREDSWHPSMVTLSLVK